jgi:alpha-galactosidase
MPTYGKGDYREPALHVRNSDGSRLLDLKYKTHIVKTKPSFKEMPETKGFKEELESLIITLIDEVTKIEVDLYYTPFIESDTFTRRMIVRNNSNDNITIEKAMSMSLDMFNDDYYMTSFDGAWIRERMINSRKLEQGILKIDSKRGVSSADHNPFIVISQDKTNEMLGKCYGFGLVYSGNFEAVVEKSPFDILRVQMGVNSFDFFYKLNPNEEFITPEVVMSFSKNGFNTLSQNYHSLIKNHIIKPDWNEKERPVLFNNWEATMFDFNEKKIISLAKKAKSLGIELFVLDDGWFGERNDDTKGLGDWYVNKKKLPSGIDKLAKKINDIGLDFGIWVEPEMVNPDSDLYRKHPDWVIRHPKRDYSLGRNQLILDLTKEEVRDYIVDSMISLIDSANIKYVKWDMNRTFSDLYSNTLSSNEQGSIIYKYQLGLYNVLERITTRFKDVLFESCASGGNRFDMGMLYYMPQVWASDNTDGFERQKIQYGTSYCYPQSVMGAHVSDSPSAQVVRRTPLETRFNVACFGLLGYEFDLSHLTKFEKKVIKSQIDFYKRYRKILQFGELYRIKSPFSSNNMHLAVVSKDKKECILGIFKTLEKPNGSFEKVDLCFLNESFNYQVKNRTQYHNLKKFGYLVKHALPIKLNPNGSLFHRLSNFYLYETEKDERIISGDKLVNQGFIPKQNFIGTGISEDVRLMGDFGSRLYYFKALEAENEKEN